MRRLIATTGLIATTALVAAGLTAPATAAPVKPTASPSHELLLIDTSTGGHDHPVADATITVLNPAGTTVATGRTNGKGAEIIRVRTLPPSFTVRVSGGTVDGEPNSTVLEAPGSRGPQSRLTTVFVDPITTAGMHLTRLRGGSAERNLAMVRAATGFPTWLRQSQIANADNVIDRGALLAFVEANGGLDRSVRALATKVDRGEDVPDLFGLSASRTLPRAGAPEHRPGVQEPAPAEPVGPGKGSRPDKGARPGNDASPSGGAAGTGTPPGLQDTFDKGRPGAPDPGRNGKQTRALSSSSVGLYLMGQVVYGVSGSAGTAIIGSIFGDSSVTKDELGDIDTQLATIASDLAVLEYDMQEMLKLQNVTISETIAASMTTIVTNTNTQWEAYSTFAQAADPTASDYQQTVEDFASAFERAIEDYIGEFDNLFSVPATGWIGYLEQMFTMEEEAVAWYQQADIVQLQNTVDYYGTLQAQATALLMEAWQTPDSPTYSGGETDLFIQSYLDGYTQQNSDVYLSWPQDIGDNEVVVPGPQVAYSLAPYTLPNEADKWVTYTSSPTSHPTSIVTSCTQGAYNEGTKHLSSPASVSGATMSSQFATVVPAGSTQADTTDFGPLSQPRGGTYTTSLLKPSGSTMEVMVTLDSTNGVSQQYGSQDQRDKSETYTWHFAGWLWCHDHTLDLTTSNQWQTNPYYSGSVASPSHQFKVGVLVSRPGTWAYVQPTD